MIVKVAKNAGFCFGVKKAVDKAFEVSKEYKKLGVPVYTYGQIIHNETVIADLEQEGVKIIETPEEIEKLSEKSVIIIRSHGVAQSIYDLINENGHILIDATCPFVSHIHDIVEKESENGEIIIIGNHNHAEVEGTKGWCQREPYVVSDEEDIDGLPAFGEDKVTIVAQTTFNLKKFEYLVELLTKKYYNVNVCRTICNATEIRQKETAELASEVDAMLVIGGKNSSNTQKLFEISRNICKDTYYIQTLDDMEQGFLDSVGRVGITAGASTPNKIIMEVSKKMSEENKVEEMSTEEVKTEETNSFADLLENEETVSIRNGQKVEGEVIAVKEDEIIVDIHYKSEGVISKNEYSADPNINLLEAVKPGDHIVAKVIKSNDGEGQVVLSARKVEAERSYAKIEEAFNNGEVLKGKVVSVLPGGLTVLVDACKVFIPASLVSDVYERNLDKYLDTEVEFKLIECDLSSRKKRIIGDRKQIISQAKAEAAKALFDSIEVKQVVEGTVKNITDFGAFVDLGGADGLLHISEMSWGRVDNPKKIFKIGDKVKCFIKDINGEKIALSLKFEDENPWINAAEKYAKGSIVTGKVARMTDFGAFIILEPGIDALLHVSQISNQRVEKPSDVYKVGDEVTAKVVDFNPENKKISLSVRVLLDDEDTKAEATEETAEEAAPAEEAAEEAPVAEEAVAEEPATEGAAEEAAPAEEAAEEAPAAEEAADAE